MIVCTPSAACTCKILGLGQRWKSKDFIVEVQPEENDTVLQVCEPLYLVYVSLLLRGIFKLFLCSKEENLQ